MTDGMADGMAERIPSAVEARPMWPALVGTVAAGALAYG